MESGTLEPASHRLPIGRDVAPLSAPVAANSSMLQLTAALASISLAPVREVGGLQSLWPAIVLAAGALTAIPAGRAIAGVPSAGDRPRAVDRAGWEVVVEAILEHP